MSGSNLSHPGMGVPSAITAVTAVPDPAVEAAAPVSVGRAIKASGTLKLKPLAGVVVTLLLARHSQSPEFVHV